MFEVIEWHELDNIRSHILVIRLRVQCLIITVQLLHSTEVSIADAHNNDSHWQLGPSDDLINRLVHVIDHAIGNDHQNVELLVVLVHLLRLDMAAYLRQDLVEMSRSVELDIVQGALVRVDHFLHTIDTWVKDITVQGKAVRCAAVVWGHGTTKAIQVDLLIAVVELENVADGLDRLEILVAHWVEIVEGAGGPWVSV